jgi:hypothetical protein
MQLYKNNFDSFFIVSNKIEKTTDEPVYTYFENEHGDLEKVIKGYTTEHLVSYEEISVEEAVKLLGKLEVKILLATYGQSFDIIQ